MPTSLGKKTEAGSLSVSQHCLDVACCMEVILTQPVYRRRVETVLGRSLDSATLERLLALTFLHDMGKLCTGFQARIQGWASEAGAGHLSEALFILDGSQPAITASLRIMDIIAWGDSAMPLLLATLAHHGRPICTGNADHVAWRRLPVQV